ncbi:unnamed protein product, partial [Caenorhabditis brenneri]
MASNELDCWKTDLYIEEYIELMNFLIERTKDAESPLSINQLAKEFKEKSGSSQSISCLFYRIRTLREKAAELDTIDTATKVRMMFALSAPIDEDFLKELRVDSHVEVDGKNRITEYKAKDGGLEFEGDHSGSAKRRSRSKKMISEKSQNASPKTPGSTKRGAPEVPNSSKRAKDSSPARFMEMEDHAPDDSARIPESGAREQSHHPKKQRKMENEKSQESAEESENHAPDDSTKILSRKPEHPNPGSQLLRQSELEGAPGAPTTLPHEETSNFKNWSGPKASGDSMNDFDDGSQEHKPKTPGSVKRAAEVPNTSNRSSSSADSMSSEGHAPEDSDRIPEPRPRKLVCRFSPNSPSSRIQQLPPKKQMKMEDKKSQEDSVDGSMNPITKNPGSVKKGAAEIPNSSKKAKDSSPARSMKPEYYAPNDSAGIPESKTREPSNPGIQRQTMVTEKSQDDSDDGSMDPIPKTPGSVKRPAEDVSNSSKKAKDSSSSGSMKSKDHAPNDSARTPETGAREQSSPKTPNPGIQSPREPFPETPRARTRQEASVLKGAPRTPGDDIPQEKPIKGGLSLKKKPGVDDAYTPRIKLLEAIQSLVLSLDMPFLSPLLTRIEKKLRELSSNDKIPNDEMAAALVVKITNDSVSNLPESVESVSLSHFLCYLKSVILNSKLEGLENLLEKIKRRIKEPSTKDK